MRRARATIMITVPSALVLMALLAGEAHAVAGGRGVLQREVPPSVARVYVKRLGSPAPQCGGVVVGANAVLTAAHCVVGPSGAPRAANTVWVRAPGLARDPVSPTGIPRIPDRLVAASRIVLPRSATTTRYSFDAALIVLDTDVQATPAELPPPWISVSPGRSAFVYGYGPGFREAAGRLRVARFAVSKQSVCTSVGQFRAVWSPSVMRCIGKRGSLSATCGGDSGSPAYAGEGKSLLGVVSFSLSTSCTRQRAPGPNALARVDCGPLRRLIDREFVPMLEIGIDDDGAVMGDATATLPNGDTMVAPLRREASDRDHLRATLALPLETPDGTKVAFEIRLSAADGGVRRLSGQAIVAGRTWALVGAQPTPAEGCPRVRPVPVISAP